jgi:hypothetical protein
LRPVAIGEDRRQSLAIGGREKRTNRLSRDSPDDRLPSADNLPFRRSWQACEGAKRPCRPHRPAS